jgi:hypothetical protein
MHKTGTNPVLLGTWLTCGCYVVDTCHRFFELIYCSESKVLGTWSRDGPVLLFTFVAYDYYLSPLSLLCSVLLIEKNIQTVVSTKKVTKTHKTL